MESTLLTNTCATGASSFSHERGPTDIPLLEETIGENLRRTVERFADREALVVRHQGYRATYGELWEQVELAARALIANGVQQGRPRRDLGAEPLRVGRHSVRDRAGRRDPGHDQPGVQGRRARVRAAQGRREPAGDGPRLPAGRLRRDARRGARRRAPQLRVAIVSKTTGTRSWPRARASASASSRRARRRCVPSDPINIQYTSGTTGSPKGATLSHRNILNNAYFDRRERSATPSTTASACRCRSTTASGWCSATSPARPTAPASSCPAESFDAREVLAAVDERALHVAVRRADDVHRRARPSPTSTRFDLAQPAHRDHGRRAVPGRGDEAGALADAHGAGHDRLRDDRDRAGLDADGGRRSGREARQHGRPGRTRTSRSRSIDPATGATVPRGTPGEQCTRGYSVMLGYWDDPDATAAGDRRRRLDAHRRPGGDGRRRLRAASSAGSRT